MSLSLVEIAAAFMVLFAIIDIFGSVPVILDIKSKAGEIGSLKAEYEPVNILIALTLNMVIVFLVLKLTSFFERILGAAGLHILRKIFGIILLAIAVRLFLSNTGIILPHAR